MKNKLIPDLRFPEFKNDGEWEEKKLGEVGVFIGGGTPNTTKAEYWNGNIQWYTPTEIKGNNLGLSMRTITNEGLKNSSAKELPKGAILITTRATIGEIAIANFECTTNQGIQSLIVKKSEYNIFWNYWLLHHKSDLIRNSSGSTFPEIGKNELIKINVLRPKLPEQEKIASCLSSLDELISDHSQKLEVLKEYKKGLMQNLFPTAGHKVPKLRFPEFKNDGEWEEKKLGEVGVFLKGKGISKSDIVENGSLPCIRYGELYTYYNETINSIKSFTNLIKEDLVLSISNDVLIPASGHTQIDIAKASCVNINGIAVGSDINILRTDLNGVFLSFYLNNAKKKQISDMAQGISVVHIYAKQLSELKLSTPKLPEQEKIASCLSSLDELISDHSQKLEVLKEYKKGLMQGLFPKN